MPSTRFAVMYSRLTGRIRWVLLPDDDREIEGFASSNPGEDCAIMDRQHYGSVDVMQAHLSRITGKTPANDRYCQVDERGTVVGVHIADPVGCGDMIDGHSLIPHPEADDRWRFDHASARFVEPEQ